MVDESAADRRPVDGSAPAETVAAIRRFNRSWTEVLGLLDRGLLETDHSLAEARVLYELRELVLWPQSDLRERLGMDASFLSRVVGRLERAGLVSVMTSEEDARARILELTDVGRRVAGELVARSDAQVGGLLAPLSGDQRRTVVESTTVLRELFRPRDREPSVEIREVRAGDLGWVIGRHGAIYADEYGWNLEFEALVARIVADHFDPARADAAPGAAGETTDTNAWIATVDGARAGCVFCCRHDASTAQLRILLVEPWARGLGLGRRLVDTCVDFARANGDRRIVLWTNDILVAARRIYQDVGFTLVDEEPHHSFGHDLVGQNWGLDLV